MEIFCRQQYFRENKDVTKHNLSSNMLLYLVKVQNLAYNKSHIHYQSLLIYLADESVKKYNEVKKKKRLL